MTSLPAPEIESMGNAPEDDGIIETASAPVPCRVSRRAHHGTPCHAGSRPVALVTDLAPEGVGGDVVQAHAADGPATDAFLPIVKAGAASRDANISKPIVVFKNGVSPMGRNSDSGNWAGSPPHARATTADILEYSAGAGGTPPPAPFCLQN